MKQPLKNLTLFARQLHRDENAAITVEWMMVITVALVVLTAIYYFATWAMNSTAETVKSVTGKDK